MVVLRCCAKRDPQVTAAPVCIMCSTKCSMYQRINGSDFSLATAAKPKLNYQTHCIYGRSMGCCFSPPQGSNQSLLVGLCNILKFSDTAISFLILLQIFRYRDIVILCIY